MFRNLKLQRAIAYTLMSTITTMTMVTSLAAAQGLPAGQTTALPTGWMPLTRAAVAGAERKGLLQLDAKGVAGVKAPKRTTGNAALPTGAVDEHVAALWRLQEAVKAHGKVADTARATTLLSAARREYRAMLALEGRTSTGFAATEAKLRAAKLPPEILQRHQSMVAEFATRSGELRKAMAVADDAAAGKGGASAALQGIGRVFDRFSSQVAPARHEKNSLPWGHRKYVPNRPASDARQLERLFPRSVMLAANGSLSGIKLPDAILGSAPLAGDLAETADAQLTPAIRALATKLSNNPVQIYNWVRNNVQYTVGYGAMQGADATLQSMRGNDVDTASLLIALYRAANIPARYAYGTIEVPAARLQNWLGVNTSEAAQTLLNAAGIPNVAVAEGGQTSAVKLEHVWVKAYVDFSPSRGAVNKTPGKWVDLDPSYKLAQDKAALNVRNDVSLNEAGVFDGFKAGAFCSADTAHSVNVTSLQTSYAGYATRLATYLSQAGSEPTVGDVLGARKTIPENYSILLGTLKYKTVAPGVEMNVLPDWLRWQFRFQLFADATAQGQGNATAALNSSLAALASKRVTLSFAPATQADAATLATFMPAAHADGSPILASEFPASVPGYLIRVKAELRADGQLVSSGGSFVLGSTLSGELGMFEPASGSWNNTTIAPRAGDFHALAIDAQGVPASQLDALKTRLATTQAALLSRPASLTRDEVSGDVLYQAALAYFATADSNSATFQRAAGVVAQRLPSYGRAVAPVKPHMVLGIVSKVSFPGATLVIDRMDSAVASNSGGLNALAFVRQEHQRNSAYAHQVASKMFSDAQHPATAVSAVKVLAAAATQGMPVYAVTSANLAAMLPQLNLSADALTQLQNNVAAGFRVLTPQTMVTVGDWSGYAMQIEDVANGGGSFVLIEELGNATAGIYPAQGMGWLALAQPFQSGAAIAPALKAGQDINSVLAAAMNAATTRWSYFAGQAELANGLFLGRIAAMQGAQPCDILGGILAANLGTSTSFDQSGGISAPPVITSVPESAGAAGQAYAYAAAATDPQGLALKWSLVEAASGMLIGASGAITWAAPISGDFYVTVRADNGRAYAEQRYLLTVGKEALPLDISLAVAPAIVGQGETVTITMLTNGGSGTVTRSLKIDGVTIPLNSAGQAVVTGSVMGAHQIIATATDKLGTQTKSGFYSVRNPGDSVAPTAEITSPVADAEITAPVSVIGTAVDANLAYYQLLLRPAGTQAWQEIGRGTQSVTAGVLGKLDPTQLMNGIYELALNVVDANGQVAQSMVTLDVYRDLKIGQFSISFEDLNIDASGIPIRVTRTYDTRRKAESLDFGYGWSVDYQNLLLRKNFVVGTRWKIVTRAADFSICLLPEASHKINITLPSGKVERFVARNAQDCSIAQVPKVDIKFSPLPGTNSKLEALNVPAILEARGGDLYDFENFEPWNPRDFKLTTDEKYTYFLTEGIGITKVVDAGGNTLTYGQNGIIHSNGQSVEFTRNASQRITAITDPAGKKIYFGYSSTGDLLTVTDRTGAVSKFSYNSSHGVTGFTDPSGSLSKRYVYDADGRLTAIFDASGRAIEMQHDLSANRQTVKDRAGNITTYTYDSAGNIVEIINALNQKTSVSFDALGNEVTLTNSLNEVTQKSFDPLSGSQLSETDALQNRKAWEYDAVTRTRITGATDANGNVTTFQYFENAERITEPAGRVTTLKYGAGEHLEAVTVAGQKTSFGFDSKGNKTSETDAAGNVTIISYDSNNQEVGRSWTRIINGQSSNVYTSRKLDPEGRVLEETDALGYTTKFTYSNGGQLLTTVDPQARLTSYEYDNRGMLAKTTYADGLSETIAYDANGNKAASTDRQARITKFQYDALDRLVLTIFPDGSTAGLTYDPAGRVQSTIDAKQNATINTYDAAGRLVKITGPDLRVTRFGYDSVGNRTDIWDAAGTHTKFDFDALNRVTLVHQSDGKTASTKWNSNGTKQSETDFAGQSKVYLYDAMGRLTQVTETDGATAQVTVYGLDPVGNRISQLDAEGRMTRWEYDVSGRITTRVLPGMQKETFSYDALDNLTKKVDFAGASIAYGYDALSQPNFKKFADGSLITTVYTPSGMVAAVTIKGSPGSGLQSGTTSYHYDARDRLVRRTNVDGSFIAYAYDADGNVAQRSTSAGTISYIYDISQRLDTVVDAAGKSSKFSYDEAGRLVSTALPNGVVANRKYDTNGRLQHVLHTLNGAIVTGTAYILAANGQRIKTEEYDDSSRLGPAGPVDPRIARAFIYDSVGRLKEERLTDRSGELLNKTEYLYDKAGNRSAQTVTSAAGIETVAYTYDVNDRLIREVRTTPTNSEIATSYTWDANGNLGSKTVGNDVTVFLWNGENLLTEVKRGPSIIAANSIAKYFYDSVGNRVQKLESIVGHANKTTSYLIDDTFPHAEALLETVKQGDATESVSYVWGIELIEQLRGGKGTFYHTDGLGSIRAVTDESGTRKATYQFDAFGEREEPTVGLPNAYRYTGQHFDDTIGLQYNRARWYDPAIGRFISFDSFTGHAGTPASLNKYAYAHGDPVNLVDPSGLAPSNLSEAMVVTQVSNARATGQTAVFQVTMRKTGCFVITHVVGKVIDEGIYIFLDAALGMPYVGKTTQGFDKRIEQHIYENSRKVVVPVMARFHVSPAMSAKYLADLEQTIMNAFGKPGRKGPLKTLSNLKNAVNLAQRKLLKGICP